MKVLVVTRIYTAMAGSFRSRVWRPKGMPAYYKLIEGLNKNDEAEAVCLGKVIHQGLEKREILFFPDLNIRFHIVPFREIKLIGRGMNRIINEIIQFFYSLRLVYKNNYDLIYVDRVNVIIGAIFAAFLRKKVVLRLHGTAFLNKRLSGFRKWFKEPIRYLSFKAPFSYIICTRDGSGAQYFIDRFTNGRSPYKILLNGVDKNSDIACHKGTGGNFIKEKYDIEQGQKIMLFLTRLDSGKGAGFFIKALYELRKRNRKFLAVVVGDGPLKRELEGEVEKNNLSDTVKFEGPVDHDAVRRYFSASDIYVSLNFIGNLCNTVLEAINAGKCIITLKGDEASRRDIDTQALLKDCAVFIDRDSITEELPDAIELLLADDKKLKELSLEAEKLSLTLLKNWDERIDEEIELMLGAIQGF